MSFTGEALNLPSKVRTSHCYTFKYRNQFSALSVWICCCSGGAGVSLDEMPGVEGKPWRLRHCLGLLWEHMTGKKGIKLEIWVVIPVVTLGSIPRLPPPPFLIYQGDGRGGMMILCVYFKSFLLVARDPSMPSLWKEAAAPDCILIKQQNKLPVHFLCFFSCCCRGLKDSRSKQTTVPYVSAADNRV